MRQICASSTWRARHRTSLISGALALILAALLTGVVAAPAGAAIVRPFTPVFSAQTNGALAVTGNVLLTCGSSPACIAGQTGASTASNNAFAMVPLDVDADSSTATSSSASIALPTGGSVLFAALVWGAGTRAGTGGTAATGDRGTLRFKVPGGSYRAITASQVDDLTVTESRGYSSYADVTSLVAAAGAGEYWAADISTSTGADRYAGWSLVVAYQDPASPLRDLTVFGGSAAVRNQEAVQTTIDGFVSPATGSVNAEIGTVAFEGDLSTNGDALSVNGTRLTDALSAANNYFASRVSANGVSRTDRTPAYLNTMGLDAKTGGATGLIPNGATSATVTFATSGDVYQPAVLTTQIDLYAPDVKGTKTVVNLDGHTPAEVGDTLEYTLEFANTGDEAATGVVIDDVLPEGSTFVPGSLVVTSGAGAGARTDAAGDDAAEYLAAGRTVRFRVGSGADATSGGSLATGGATSAAFRATVAGDAVGKTLVNTGLVAYTAPTVGSRNTYRTVPTRTPVADAPAPAADLSVDVVVEPPAPVPGEDVTVTVIVDNAGPDTAPPSTVDVVLQPDLTEEVSVQSTAGDCTAAPSAVECALPAIPAGGAVTVDVTGQVDPGEVGELTTTATVVPSGDDPDPADNTATATVPLVAESDLIVDTGIEPTAVISGDTVVSTTTVVASGPSDAQDVALVVELPDGLAPTEAAEVTNGSCELQGQVLSCELGVLAAGEKATVTVPATASGAAGAILRVVARTSTGVDDPVAANDVSTATLRVLAAPTTGPDTSASSGSPPLARTGTDVGPQLAWSAILVAVGLALIGMSRGRLMATPRTPVPAREWHSRPGRARRHTRDS